MKNLIREFILVIFFLGAAVTSLQAAESAVQAWEQSDHSFCKQCHSKEAEDIEIGGMAHKTNIECTDCHTGHKPKSFENIPLCSQCHEGTEHYDLLQCLNCHRNPHRPMQIKLPKKAHKECLTCHDSQGEEFQQFPSYHSTLVCTDCHDEHGYLPACMSCHKSHADSMMEQACQDCHAPHKPLELTYGNNVPSSFCSPCHPEINELLEKTQTKHSQLSCAECHINRHEFIPACENCHGKLHADALHKKFPDCNGCHNTAHSLE